MKKYISGDKVFQLVVNVVLFLFMCVELYPILYIISASVSDPDAVAAGKLILLPIGFSLDGYKNVFEYRDIWMGYANTIFYTVAGTCINLIVTLPCAYALSRKELVGRNGLMIFFMVVMYINGGLVPRYLNVKSFGLTDTRIFMLINGAISVYNMIVARTFFASSIPYEITESARIDGCSDAGIFAKIVMPVSKAIVTVMVLYYGVTHWNSYFNAMIYLEDRNKYPLAMILREVLLRNKFAMEALSSSTLTPEEVLLYEEMAKNADRVKYCIIIVASLPMMIIYPKLQKYFEKGVLIGSVKG